MNKYTTIQSRNKRSEKIIIFIYHEKENKYYERKNLNSINNNWVFG